MSSHTVRSPEDISFFLRLGYFPNYEARCPLDLSGVNPAAYQDAAAPDLIDQGAALFRAAIARGFQTGQNHVVPLSGGLDSRAVLAALLEHTEAGNITTYTFGTPGTWDYDIGYGLARRLGTKHVQIDLTSVHWTLDDLLETARRQDAQTFLFHHVPTYMLDQFKGSVIWSGYIGDAVTGGHLKSSPAQRLPKAQKIYIQSRAVIRSIALPSGSCAHHLGGGEIDPAVVSYDEQVLLSEVGKVTAPHVLPQGFVYRTPFIDQDFMNFFLSLPRTARLHQKLFISMLRQHWSDLISYPTKSHYGFGFDTPPPRIWARRARNRILRFGHDYMPYMKWPPHPGTNFFNFDQAIRRDESLRHVVRDLLRDIEDQNIVSIDIPHLWRKHMACRGNYGDVFKILSSLVVNMRVQTGGSLGCRTSPP